MRLQRTAYRPERRRTGVMLAAITMAAFIGSAPASWADYRLQPGDVVELAVAGMPQLGLRAPLQLDGTLTFPFVGTVDARGETISDVRERIQTTLASKVLRLHADDGSESLRTVEREDITVFVVEYRPVTIGGAVARPGEIAFRPEMTVRHALAAAGGVMTPLQGGPNYDAVSLRGDYVSTWLALAAQHARMWRLNGELGVEKAFDASAIPAAPVGEADFKAIVDLEVAYRKADDEDLRRQKAFLEASIAQADEHIAVLVQQQQREEEGVEVDAAEVKRSDDLVAQGTVVHSRLMDARRDLLMSSTRLLQTQAQMMQVRRQRHDLARDLELLGAERTMKLTQQLQEATLEAAADRERLRTIEQKLQAAGMQVPSSTPNGPPAVTVYRQDASGRTVELDLGYDSTLEPGDVVEVSIASATISQ